MMKTFCLIILPFLSGAQTPIWFRMSEVTGSGAARAITITPLDGPMGFYGTNIAYSGPITIFPTNPASISTPATAVAVTNLVAGNYRFTFAGLPNAMTVFWPGDPTITNAADVRIQRTGLVSVFTGPLDVAAGSGVTIVSNLNLRTISSTSGGGSGVTNNQVLTGIPSSTNGNFAGNFAGNLVGGTNYQGSNVAGAVLQAAHATNADIATLASFVSGTLSNSISGNAATATQATLSSFVSGTLTNSTLTNVLYSSKLGCYGDSDLVLGGGHDDRAKLQAAIDQATNGPVEVVIERPTLISTGLMFRSNLRLRGLPGAGLYLASGANVPALWNGIPFLAATNVLIENLEINHNGANQAHNIYSTNYAWDSGVMVGGADRVRLSNVRVSHSKTWSFFFVNCGDIVLDSCYATNSYSGGGHDAYHFWGNYNSVTMLHCVSTNCDDDVIAFNLNEADGAGDTTGAAGYFARQVYVDDFQAYGGYGFSIDESGHGGAFDGTNYYGRIVLTGLKNLGLRDRLGGGTYVKSLSIQGSDSPGTIDLSGILAGDVAIRGLTGTAAIQVCEGITNVSIANCSVTAGGSAGFEYFVSANQLNGPVGGYPYVTMSGCVVSPPAGKITGNMVVGGGVGTFTLAGNINNLTNTFSGSFAATPTVALGGNNSRFNGGLLTNVTAKALSDGGVVVNQSGGALNITAAGTGDFVSFGPDANGNGVLGVPQVSGGTTATNSTGYFVQNGNHANGFVGHGGGLSNLNASALSSGTVAAGRLPDLSTTYEAHVATLTNAYSPAKAALDGTQFPLGTICTNGANTNVGAYMRTDGSSRFWSFDGSGQTNLNNAVTTLFTSVNASNTSGTAETILWTNTLAANTLSAAGAHLAFHLNCTSGASGNATWKIYLGSTVIFNSGSQNVQNLDYYIDADAMRGSTASTQVVTGGQMIPNGNALHGTVTQSAENLGNALGLGITCANTVSSSTLRSVSVTLYPASR